MRYMRNIRALAKKLTSYFNQCIYKNHYRGWNRNQTPDKYHRAGKENCISKQNRINRAACPKQKYLVLPCKFIDQERKEATQSPANQIEKQEFPAAYRLFKADSKHKQSQHIKENMLKILMYKHVRKKLPVHMIVLYKYWIHSTIIMNIFREIWIHKTNAKNEKIYENDKKSIPSVGIRKRSAENKSIFWHLQTSAQPCF